MCVRYFLARLLLASSFLLCFLVNTRIRVKN
nr:MAG TPA: hypothetical protein [Caudoviricetes sp.]